jgi:hypothetical protein
VNKATSRVGTDGTRAEPPDLWTMCRFVYDRDLIRIKFLSFLNVEIDVFLTCTRGYHKSLPALAFYFNIGLFYLGNVDN